MPARWRQGPYRHAVATHRAENAVLVRVEVSITAHAQQEVEVFLPSPVSRRARASSAEELELQNRPQRATSGPREQVLGCQGHALPGRSCVVLVRGKERGCKAHAVVFAGLTW